MKYGEGTVELKMNDQYYNMKEKIDPNMHVIELVLQAMQQANVAPKVQPIRGGTDGARNFHSRAFLVQTSLQVA